MGERKFPKVMNYGKIVMTEENLKAYALYLKKYVEAYADEGKNYSLKPRSFNTILL